MLTVTIGPARPRLPGFNRIPHHLVQPTAAYGLARIAARYAPTTVLDPQGGAMVLGDTAASGDVELF